MATLADVRLKVLRLLADTTGASYNTDLLDDGIEAAHVAVLPWIFKRKSATLPGDGVETAFALPADFYQVISVFDTDDAVGRYIPEGTQAALSAPANNVDVNNEYTLYPEGYISFANAPAEDITLNYGAYWTVPSGENSNLEVPASLITPIALYTASYALLAQASNVASIRQWADKNVDSGTPVMNPMRDQSSYYLERFKIAMAQLPALPKGSR